MDREMTYEICLRGRLPEGSLEWMEGFALSAEKSENDFTILTGKIVDQPFLRGIINKLFDLNIEIISIIQINHKIK